MQQKNFAVFARVRPILEGRESSVQSVTSVSETTCIFEERYFIATCCLMQPTPDAAGATGRQLQLATPCPSRLSVCFHPRPVRSSCLNRRVCLCLIRYPQRAISKSTQALAGFNATLFAYGATGCGKTHTVSGSPQDPGVIPRALSALFERRTEVISFSMSYLEVYNEQIRDLLSSKNASLDLREEDGKVHVARLSKHRLKSVKHAFALLVFCLYFAYGGLFRQRETSRELALQQKQTPYRHVPTQFSC